MKWPEMENKSPKHHGFTWGCSWSGSVGLCRTHHSTRSPQIQTSAPNADWRQSGYQSNGALSVRSGRFLWLSELTTASSQTTRERVLAADRYSALLMLDWPPTATIKIIPHINKGCHRRREREREIGQLDLLVKLPSIQYPIEKVWVCYNESGVDQNG